MSILTNIRENAAHPTSQDRKRGYRFYIVRGLLAILYHSAANTIGIFYSHTLAGADLTRYFWLLAAVNLVAAVTVVLFDWKTWRTSNPVAQAPAEMVQGIS
jgi:hypothetical protein